MGNTGGRGAVPSLGVTLHFGGICWDRSQVSVTGAHYHEHRPEVGPGDSMAHPMSGSRRHVQDPGWTAIHVRDIIGYLFILQWARCVILAPGSHATITFGKGV